MQGLLNEELAEVVDYACFVGLRVIVVGGIGQYCDGDTCVVREPTGGPGRHHLVVGRQVDADGDSQLWNYGAGIPRARPTAKPLSTVDQPKWKITAARPATSSS